MTEDVGKIRIGCEVDSKEAKRGINDIYNSIGSLNKSINSMLNSGANTTLKAIGKVPSALKRLNNGISNVHNTANKMGNVIKKSYTELYSKIKLVTGAIKTFINTLKDLDSAYSKQVSAETRLSVAMSNSTGATRGQIQEIKDLTAEYQQLGIIGDEVQLTGLQELSTYVSSAESVKKLLPVLNDMTAQQYGFAASSENAFSIATALGKVLNGNTDTLKRYGYAFNDAEKQILKYGTEEQKVAVLTDVVTSSVGGMNEAMANTPTGQITQLKNNFGDLKESLGELLTYVILPIAKYINVIIQRAIVGVKTLTEFIKSTFGIKTVAKDVNRITDGVSSVNNKNIDKTSDSLDDLGNSASKTKKKVNNLLGSFDELNILSDNSSDSTDSLADALNSIDSDSLDLGYGVSETIEVPDINDFKKKIEELLASVDYSALGKEWGEGFNKIIDKWNPVTSAEKLANALNNIISTINNFLTTADFNKLGKKIGTWVNKFVHKFDSKALGNIISNGINGAIAFANGALTETNFKALGESIGDFIMGIFGNLDYEGLGDALINALDAAVSTAAGIISKIDFKAIGKGLAKATNKITQRTDTFRKLGKALSDAILGVFDLAITYLDETDFEQVGKAIGAFLAGLDWGTILYKAGEAIWKGLKAALSITIGTFKENPVVGTLVGIAEALLLFKGVSKVIGIIKNLGSTLGIFGKTVSTDIAQKNTSGVITKLFNSVKAFATVHPYITLILALAAAVTAVAVGVKKAMDENERYLKNRETFLKDFDVLDEKQKDLMKNTETLSKDTDELKKSISNAGGAASTSAKKYKTLYDKLSLVVNENGYVKDGCDDYVDLILGELNDAFGTNYKNIDGQIQGYDKLSSSIENYISKLKASAILEGTTDKYSQAIENYTSATTDFFESVTGAEGYEDAIRHLEDSINSVLNKYSDKGLTYSVTADATTTSAVMNELMRISELSDEASLDYMRIWSNLATISKKYNIDWDDNVKSYKKLVSFFDAGGGDLEKFSGILIENNDAFAEVLRNVAVGLDNSKNKMYENADAAQALIEDNNNIIKNYEDLESVLYDVNSTTEDIDKAFAIYTHNIKTYGNASNESLTKQSDKINAYAEKAEELYKEHKISKPIYDEIVYTQGIVNEQTKIMGEQFAKNIQESGIDAVAIKLREFAESNDISPEALFNAYVSSHTGLTQEQIIKLARILFPDSSVTELTSLITKAYTNSVISAYNKYIGTSSTLTAEDKRNFVKKLIPDVSEEAQNRIYTVLNGAISSGISRFGIGQGKKTSSGLFNKMVLNEDNKLINDKANEIGMYLSEGIAVGITKGQKYISDAQDNSSSSSLKYWNKLYGIESPSKKTKEIGEYLSEGLAVGIKSGLNKVLDAVKYLCTKTVNAYKITGMNANILKTYAYSYVNSFFNGIALKGSEIVNIKNIIDKVVSSFKITLWNSGMLTKYGNTYVNDYIKGVVLTEAHKKNISNIQNVVIVLLKPSANTLNSAKEYGASIVQSMISGMTVSSANKTTISNAGTTVYNSMISSMNNLSGSLSTSSNNFIHNLTNPITNGLSALLSSMDSFYIKFRNKWQGVANLLSNKFIGNSMGITKVPNLNDNYYPFGDNIVRLAQGAVIKPNNEFMAILGDQKRGVNIETPLATMKQAFMEALNDGGYAGGNITIPVYIGNEKIDTLIINSNNRRNMRNNGRG